MIRIRDESDFKNWFKKNYKKLGFDKIVKGDGGTFPDFIMLENGKKTRVELEIKSSNFILHRHSIKKVDKIICIEKDVDLDAQVIELKNFKLVEFNKKSPYSLENQIYKLFSKEKFLMTSEVARMLNIKWNTAESYLKELLIENKVERIKKIGANLWTKK